MTISAVRNIALPNIYNAGSTSDVSYKMLLHFIAQQQFVLSMTWSVSPMPSMTTTFRTTTPMNSGNCQQLANVRRTNPYQPMVSFSYIQCSSSSYHSKH